jgi:choline dehydrogenase
LNSGIGDKEELEEVKVKPIHHLPDVGKGLSDHLFIPITWSANDVVQPVDNAAAFEEWQVNRTGPLTQNPSPLLMFARIPPDAPLFKEHRDPAAGPNSPHIELILAVCLWCLC